MIRSHITQSVTSQVLNENKQMVRTAPKPPCDNDVVICATSRTPLTKAKKGALRDTAIETLLAHVIKDVCKKANCDMAKVDDIAVGNVLAPGAAATVARIASFLAGFPHTTSVYSVNRFCSSGLQAIADVANAIRAGQIDIGIGSGVESMSAYSFNDSVRADLLAEEVFEHETARNCLMGMGQTSDNVAKEFNVTREMQDEFAAKS